MENVSYGHPHWALYPPPSTTIILVSGIILLVFAVISILGNAFVIGIFCSSPSLRTPANMLILNLSWSDLMMSTAVPMVTVAALEGKWVFGKVGCDIHAMVVGIFGLMSMNTIAAIAFERYKVIVRSCPTKGSRRQVAVSVVVTWLYSILWTLPPIFGWGQYILEGTGTSCTFDFLTQTLENRLFVLALFIGGFVVPFLVILVCYCNVFYYVHASNKLLFYCRTKKALKSEVKVVKMTMVILLLFCLSWIPYSVVALIGTFGDATQISPLTAGIPVIFAKSSAMYNPVIYTFYHQGFRRELRRRRICGRLSARFFNLSSSFAQELDVIHSRGRNSLSVRRSICSPSADHSSLSRPRLFTTDSISSNKRISQNGNIYLSIQSRPTSPMKKTQTSVEQV
ncbi:rhodopsin, GQ-coupled-like [Lingula anatina]|uniref:Rhodopsin, GQ-coupled-like n=1 Tax=Lingula anatina TaxID=7574 RepID=A0A1S3JAY8_LINAN|nr:rhodopsin, GQ-coupled-like [Lingula anatina]XP_013407360.1 rhodopsin, GQ-coupled-like [Lingula anatina]XP_013407361.1 rhodopsin, GQ-coupled-like [Lingula anatina]|eukprot:XP_013407359.1 rhodopsin, GQ-coupled-like [Lingula anatina]